MSRNKIMDALKECATQLGYAIYSSDGQEINQSIKEYPAIWVDLPKATKVEGRNQIIVTYAVEIALLQIAKKLTQSQKITLWSELENDGLKITKLLNQNPMIRLAQTQKTTPEQFTLTNNGELSVKIVMSVELIPEKL